MAINYAKMAETTRRLITSNGRPVSIVRLSRDNPTDAAKPWRGQTSPRADPESVVTATGCFVEPSSLVRFGIEITEDEIRRVHEIVLVAATDTNNIDFDGYDEVWDGDTSLRIILIRTLKPNDSLMFTVLGVVR